jgi:NTP pyrophosphatase (non-canonical NTP hydrolase)
VLEILKKRVRDGHFDKDHLKKELGDVLYYWTRLCTTFDLTPQEVLEANVAKLEDRLARNVMSGSGNDR